ncbi:MAG: putative photosynthetic complex assembly protein PuhE [Pseudomonadota bacterium]
MTAYGVPVLAALFLWWFSTGAVFWLVGRRRWNPLIAQTAATGSLALALAGLVQIRGEATVTAAYLSFACGVVAWAWLEVMFLTGGLTGPRKIPCPPRADGLRRFVLAVETVLWHEAAAAALGVLMVWISWGHPNQVGAWTFVLLLAMRVSAKFNLFMGVPYPPAELLPAHLAHMGSYFRRRAITPLMPAAITLATLVAALVAWRAVDPAATDFDAVGYTLFGTMLALGIVEHWLMILPLKESVLWRWFMETDLQAATRPATDCDRSNAHAHHTFQQRRAPELARIAETPTGG